MFGSNQVFMLFQICFVASPLLLFANCLSFYGICHQTLVIQKTAKTKSTGINWLYNCTTPAVRPPALGVHSALAVFASCQRRWRRWRCSAASAWSVWASCPLCRINVVSWYFDTTVPWKCCRTPQNWGSYQHNEGQWSTYYIVCKLKERKLTCPKNK